MKTKYNLVGDTFTHLSGGNLGYSVHGKESKHIEWVHDGSGVGTFFVDRFISEINRYEVDIPKYAWILESRSIIQELAHVVEANIEYYESKFDMIFTHDAHLMELSPVFKFVPAQGSWIQQPMIYPKTKLISMIASNKDWCAGHIARLGWVKALRPHLDLYGRGFNYIELKEQGLCDYMFSVAIENGSYETYFTEKILDCFLTGTIPVYVGAPDIAEHFNPDGIVMLNKDFNIHELTPDFYYDRMDIIKENFEKALACEVLEDYIWEHYLCQNNA